MALINDNGLMRDVDYRTAERLERRGVIQPCTCNCGGCGGPMTYHLAPGKTVSDLNYHANEMLSEERRCE